MEDRKCENCVHAKPYGGENDNRCDAWECDFIDRTEAAKAYKARKGKIILRQNVFMRKEDFEALKKEWEAENPETILVPVTMEALPPMLARWAVKYGNNDILECSACGYRYHKQQSPHRFCPNCGARMEGVK
jgi:rubrerythrin